MATTTQETGRHIALVDIRVPDNVRELDPEHVKALAGSIELQGMLVPVVVRNDGKAFELVAGFHRIAAARSLGLNVVPVVVRDAVTEDADRAVENITSCRCRHEVINADLVVMPMSVARCPRFVANPGGEVGITSQDGIQAVKLWHTTWPLKWRLLLRLRKRARYERLATRSRFVHCERERDASRDDRIPCQSGGAGPPRIDPWMTGAGARGGPAERRPWSASRQPVQLTRAVCRSLRTSRPLRGCPPAPGGHVVLEEHLRDELASTADAGVLGAGRRVVLDRGQGVLIQRDISLTLSPSFSSHPCPSEPGR